MEMFFVQKYYNRNFEVYMKNAKILIAVLFALLSSAALSAQDFETKTVYRTGVYGQTFELYERFNV